MKKIIIFGGTGFIGGRLISQLKKEFELIVLSRNPDKYVNGFDKDVRLEAYDLSHPFELVKMFENAHGVINLTGENVGAGRWTQSFKEKILISRLDVGNFIRSVFELSGTKPSFLFSVISCWILWHQPFRCRGYRKPRKFARWFPHRSNHQNRRKCSFPFQDDATRLP